MRMARTLSAATVAAFVALSLVPSAGAQGQEKERFNALAVHLGTGPSGQTMMEIEISRWSTEDEGKQLLGVLEKDGHRKLADALGKEKETGFIRFPGVTTQFPSTRLHYAREFQKDGKRVIVLLTNRPIGFWEAANQTRSFDYDLTLIELRLDENGDGDGVLAVGVEIGFDEQKQQLVTKNWSSSPVQLKDVKKQH